MQVQEIRGFSHLWRWDNWDSIRTVMWQHGSLRLLYQVPSYILRQGTSTWQGSTLLLWSVTLLLHITFSWHIPLLVLQGADEISYRLQSSWVPVPNNVLFHTASSSVYTVCQTLHVIVTNYGFCNGPPPGCPLYFCKYPQYFIQPHSSQHIWIYFCQNYMLIFLVAYATQLYDSLEHIKFIVYLIKEQICWIVCHVLPFMDFTITYFTGQSV